MTKRVVRVDIVVDSNDWDQPGANSDKFAEDVVVTYLLTGGFGNIGTYEVVSVEVLSEVKR